MTCQRIGSILFLIAVLMCHLSSARGDEPEIRASKLARHDQPPRKVIVGTSMTRWYSNYPGLDGRLEQIRGLIDQMAADSHHTSLVVTAS